jgi:hypothetical protein
LTLLYLALSTQSNKTLRASKVADRSPTLST